MNIDNKFLLINENEKLKIIAVEDLELYKSGKKIKSLCVDFLSPEIKKRVQSIGRKSLIAKAVGIESKKALQEKPLKVIDATAGLGIDAFTLAVLGCNVTMIERSSIIGSLLANGLMLVKRDPDFSKIKLQLVIAEAKKYLDENSSDADIIYLDPMYPERNKTALNKKEMRMLKELVGGDEDFSQLLEVALKTAKKRVVVKRPKLAVVTEINGRMPDLIYQGQTSRYDVFLIL